MSVAQLGVLAQGGDILPVIGSRRRSQLAEALAALDVPLDAGDLARIAKAVPVGAVAGERYNAHQMSVLDSERRARGPD